MSRDFVNGKGLVCKRTGELPAFEEECGSFEQDKELERLAPPKPEDCVQLSHASLVRWHGG